MCKRNQVLCLHPTAIENARNTEVEGIEIGSAAAGAASGKDVVVTTQSTSGRTISTTMSSAGATNASIMTISTTGSLGGDSVTAEGVKTEPEIVVQEGWTAYWSPEATAFYVNNTTGESTRNDPINTKQ